jgi:hypothetical protein
MFWIRNTSNKYPKAIKLLDINPFTMLRVWNRRHIADVKEIPASAEKSTQEHWVKGLISKSLMAFGYLFDVILIQNICN